jgi:hypothetical protein
MLSEILTYYMYLKTNISQIWKQELYCNWTTDLSHNALAGALQFISHEPNLPLQDQALLSKSNILNI